MEYEGCSGAIVQLGGQAPLNHSGRQFGASRRSG